MIDSQYIFDQPVKNDNMVTQEYMITLKKLQQSKEMTKQLVAYQVIHTSKKLEADCNRSEKTTSP